MISNERRGAFYALSSGLSYGFVAYFGVSIIHASLSIANMSFWRYLIASSIVLVVVIVQRKHVVISSKELLIAFTNGCLFYGFSTLLFFSACLYIGSGLSMVINYAYPAIVILFNRGLYRKQIPRRYYFSALAIIIGMLFFINPKAVDFDVFGIMVAVASSFFYACYIVSSKHMSMSMSPQASTLMVSLGCTVMCLILSLVDHSFFIPTTPIVWLNLFCIGIFSTALPILLLLKSLRYISSAKASLLSILEPIFIVILGVALLGEPMTLNYVIGIVIILGGALATLNRKEKVGR